MDLRPKHVRGPAGPGAELFRRLVTQWTAEGTGLPWRAGSLMLLSHSILRCAIGSGLGKKWSANTACASRHCSLGFIGWGGLNFVLFISLFFKNPVTTCSQHIMITRMVRRWCVYTVCQFFLLHSPLSILSPPLGWGLHFTLLYFVLF